VEYIILNENACTTYHVPMLYAYGHMENMNNITYYCISTRKFKSFYLVLEITTVQYNIYIFSVSPK